MALYREGKAFGYIIGKMEWIGEEFPEGTSIGWVIYNNGYESCVNGSGGINTQKKHFYSDKVLR